MEYVWFPALSTSLWAQLWWFWYANKEIKLLSLTPLNVWSYIHFSLPKVSEWNKCATRLPTCINIYENWSEFIVIVENGFCLHTRKHLQMCFLPSNRIHGTNVLISLFRALEHCWWKIETFRPCAAAHALKCWSNHFSISEESKANHAVCCEWVCNYKVQVHESARLLTKFQIRKLMWVCLLHSI